MDAQIQMQKCSKVISSKHCCSIHVLYCLVIFNILLTIFYKKYPTPSENLGDMLQKLYFLYCFTVFHKERTSSKILILTKSNIKQQTKIQSYTFTSYI